MAITPLPPAPNTGDPPDEFIPKADAFVAALALLVTEMNAAIAVVNMTKWISGTTYAMGDVTWSPINFQAYRRKVAGAGTTDPSADSTNWTLAIASVPEAVNAQQAVVDFLITAGKKLVFEGATDDAYETTIDPGNPTADRTLTLPNQSGTVAVTADIPAATAFASSAENAAGSVEGKAVDPLGIREAFNASGSAPVYACRAWCTFNGSGTPAVVAGGNVSSITDNGTGNYTINFTTALPDANYCPQITVGGYSSKVNSYEVASKSTTGVQILTHVGTADDSQGGFLYYDHPEVNVAIFR